MDYQWVFISHLRIGYMRDFAYYQEYNYFTFSSGHLFHFSSLLTTDNKVNRMHLKLLNSNHPSSFITTTLLNYSLDVNAWERPYSQGFTTY